MADDTASSRARSATLQLLVVSRDPTLRAELSAALGGVRSQRVLVHHVEDHRHGVEVARFRTPEVICAELGRDLGALKAFARDVQAVAPRAILAAVYGADTSETREPSAHVVIDAMRAGIRDFLRRPLSSTELGQLFDRPRGEEVEPVARPGRVISFVSNRGGVGKSTLAVNLAAALGARHPGRVLLIDAAFQAGVCATMLDLAPSASIIDVARERDRVDETMLYQVTTPHDSGLRLLAPPENSIDASDLSDETLTRVLGLARRAFDYVVVDTFPMLDSVLLTILDVSDIAYLVVQGTVPGVTRAEALFRALDALSYDEGRHRVVLSHNYPPFAGDLRRGDVERSLGRPIHHAIAYERGLLRSQNRGTPHVERVSRWSRFARAIGRIVREVEAAGAAAEPAPPPVQRRARLWRGQSARP